MTMTKNTYSRLKITFSIGKKSTASRPQAWACRNWCRLGPVAASPACGAEAGAAQDVADGASADPVPEAPQSALDAGVAPR
jgi:hypothetical protein